MAAVRSAGDDTDNGDTGDNAEDNGYHLEIISSPLLAPVTGPLCYCSSIRPQFPHNTICRNGYLHYS